MRNLMLTVTLGAALLSPAVITPALAATTVRDDARPPVVLADPGPAPVAERERMERTGEGRRPRVGARLACENGCARPAYTRE